MAFSAVLRVALRALVRNKLRTALTMLGISIGISAVICTVAIGQGGSNQIREQLEMLADNLVWIEAGSRNVAGVHTGSGGRRSLTVADYHAIAQQIPFIKLCSPQVDSRTQVAVGDQNWNTRYVGVSPDYLPIRRWTVASGTSLNEQDVQTAAKVCLLGRTVAEMLFPYGDPVGQTVRVGPLPFTVLGVLKGKGFSSTGFDQDDFILIPYTTAQTKMKGIYWLDDIMCSAISPEAVHPAQDEITKLLRQRHHISGEEENDFNIRSPEERLRILEDSSQTFTLMLASIASVSLLVGGIGIMNIMLVSVTERTREIGIRLAIGASEGSIQMQFLTEAVVLSFLGGAVGVPGGIFTSMGVSTLLGWPTYVSVLAVMTAAVFSLAVGVCFGYFPARKASRLDPIDALRYE